MNKQIEIFSRAANYTVNKVLNNKKHSIAEDHLQALINNMNFINQVLMKLAIRAIHRVENNGQIDREQLTENLRGIIETSVASYAKRL